MNHDVPKSIFEESQLQPESLEPYITLLLGYLVGTRTLNYGFIFDVPHGASYDELTEMKMFDEFENIIGGSLLSSLENLVFVIPLDDSRFSIVHFN